MSADLAVQKAIRARLAATPAVTALVAAGRIVDDHTDKAVPRIVLGDSQALDPGTSTARALTEVFHTIHVWTREPSTEGAKIIAGAIRAAIHAGRLDLGAGFHAADGRVSSMRFLRDPDGEHTHGVVVVEVLAQEVAP